MEPLADDPARVEVRRLHVICDETVHALRDGVEDANRRETLLTAVAGLAYILAGAGGSPNSSMRHRGEGGPVDERTDEVHLSASAQVRKINEAVDRLDEMIFSKPPSEAWNFDEEARFWELTEALSAACERQPVH